MLGYSLDNLGQHKGLPFNVDLIRTVAMVGVILLHASGQWLITSQEMGQLTPLGITTWAIVDVYQSLGVLSVPIFLMLTGALLLQPQKQNERLNVFFKKRLARVGLPFLFWAAVYFVWDFYVINLPLSLDVVTQGILNGAYSQFWYIYVLFGLYLITPILRAFLVSANQTLIKYFITLWIIGVAILPFFGLLTPFMLNSNVFVIGGFVGYFILGIYLTTLKMRRSTLWILLLLGVVLTAVGTYVLAATGGEQIYFFQEYISPTVILASVMLFLLLLTIKPASLQKESSPLKHNKLIKLISENTLGIFFIHVIVLESIQNGYFGIALNHNTLNPIIEVPIMTIIVLFASLAIILLLKKIPYMNRLIGSL
jgi:surface polysaccharide O-acyltransferase-like enzyme